MEAKTEAGAVQLMNTEKALQALAPLEEMMVEARRMAENRVFDYTDRKQRKEAGSLIRSLGSVRARIEDKRKALKQPYLDAGRAIDEAAKKFTAELAGMIDHHKKPIKALEEAEAKRQQEAEEWIANIRDFPQELIGMSADQMREHRDRHFSGLEPTEALAEYMAQAVVEYKKAAEAVERAIAAKQKEEDDAAELQALRAQQEERERQEREERIRKEAAEKAEREAEAERKRRDEEDRRRVQEKEKQDERVRAHLVERLAALQNEAAKTDDPEALAGYVGRVEGWIAGVEVSGIPDAFIEDLLRDGREALEHVRHRQEQAQEAREKRRKEEAEAEARRRQEEAAAAYAAAAEKRASQKRHRQKILKEASEDLSRELQGDLLTADMDLRPLVEAIAEGKIRHTTISF